MKKLSLREQQRINSAQLLDDTLKNLDSIFRESNGIAVEVMPLPAVAGVAHDSSGDGATQLSKRARKRMRHGVAASTGSALSSGEPAVPESAGTTVPSYEVLSPGQHAAGVWMERAAPSLNVLRDLLLQYGTQLLPSADVISRRLSAFITSAALSSASVWEVAEMAVIAFSSGAASLTSDLVAWLLDEPLRGAEDTFILSSVLLLNDFRSKAQRDPVAVAVRKLTALRGLLLATGAFMETKLAQRFAMRFAQDVIMGALLGTVGVERSNNSSIVGGVGASVTCHVALRVPVLELLTTLVIVVKPLPSLLAIAAISTLRLLGSDALCHLGYDEARSLSQLRATFAAMRHPHAIPFYAPPIEVVERARRAVPNMEPPTLVQEQQLPTHMLFHQQQADLAFHTTSAAASTTASSAGALLAESHQSGEQQQSLPNRVPATPPTPSPVAPPPNSTARAAQLPAPTAASVTSLPPKQQVAPPGAPSIYANPIEEDDMPDIVLDD